MAKKSSTSLFADGDTSEFIETLSKVLDLKEVELENGGAVSNMEGICRMLVEKALNGDLQVVQFLSETLLKSGR